MISGAEIMVKCLELEGVQLAFGYPGAAICPFYDFLYQSDIRHVLVREEQNAAHAASGYARSSGKPGVCIATSGPGATNLITGIATAYMDSIPLVAITGQVNSGCSAATCSGSRYHRRLRTLYKAFVSGQAREGSAARV